MESEPAQAHAGLFPYGGHGGVLHLRPEADDVRVGLAPLAYQRRQFLFREPHLQRAHGRQRADRAAVAEGEFGDLPLLPQVAVLAVLLDGHMEHLRSAGTVDVPAALKHFQPPLLAREPGDDARFDGAEVRDDEAAARAGNEGRADQFR